MTDDAEGEVVEFGLAPDVAFLAEWVRVANPMGTVVLFHDLDADLDSMRPFVRQLRRLLLDCLLVDLPGHGISGGSWIEHGRDAVRQAIGHCRSEGNPPPALVAHGRATNLVLAQGHADVSALVTIGPRLSSQDLGVDSAWRSVPVLAIVDPDDAEGQRSQKLIQGWLRAWYLRLHIRYLTDLSTSGQWPPQAPTGTAAFVAEQIAAGDDRVRERKWAAGRRCRISPGRLPNRTRKPHRNEQVKPPRSTAMVHGVCFLVGLAAVAGLSCSSDSTSTSAPDSAEESALRFADVTDQLGLPIGSYGTGFEGPCALGPSDVEGSVVSGMECMFDAMTGGVAVADLNNDGRVDVVGTRGGQPVYLGLFDPADARYSPVHLPENIRGNGIAIGDLDIDGDMDVFVAGYGTQQNFLLVNDGAGGFTEEADERGLSGGRDDGRPLLGTSAVVADVDQDGLLDVIVTEWRAGEALNATGEPTTRLFLGDPARPGTFIDSTIESGLDQIAATGYGFTISVTDVDLDGNRDILLASDYGTSLVAFGTSTGVFRLDDDVQAALTDENGMGGLVTDLDRDGIVDWLVTSIAAPLPCPNSSCGKGLSGNRAYLNNGAGELVDEAQTLGISSGGWGWGVASGDLDHDGALDLVSAAGMYFPENFRGAPLEPEGYATAPLLAWTGSTDGAGFESIELEIEGGDPPSARSIQLVDYDLDGDLDMFVGGSGTPVTVLQNQSTVTCDWVEVGVEGSHSGSVSLYEGEALISEQSFGAASGFLGMSILPALVRLPDAGISYEIRVSTDEGWNGTQTVGAGTLYILAPAGSKLVQRQEIESQCVPS